MTDCQLYLITPPQIDPPTFAGSLREALDAADAAQLGVSCLQLRLKDVSDDEVLAAADVLRPILQSAGIGLIINDRADLAKKSQADGVHLGQTDGSVAEARSMLGEDADIGVTCHDSRHLAMIAAEQGADYVAFGAFFPTTTKVTTHRPSFDILTDWSEMTLVPCVAIGGITPANARGVADAGADYLAVSSAVWDHARGAGAAVEDFATCLRAPANGA